MDRDITRQERLKIEKRIRAVSAWKRETGGETLPDWVDLDTLAPGTADVGGGYPDQDHRGYYQRAKRDWTERCRVKKIGEWTEEGKRHRKRIITAVKRRTGGTVGLYKTERLKIRCTYDSVTQGFYDTFAEAAEVYDRLARQYEGRDAITNDPEAVKREDRTLARQKAARKSIGNEKKVTA